MSWLTESKEYTERMNRAYGKLKESCKMEERNWEHKVPWQIAKEFWHLINSNTSDYEKVRKVLKKIVEFIKKTIGEDNWYYDDLLDDLSYAEFETEEDTNYYISEVYDLLDAYNIWMDPFNESKMRESLATMTDDGYLKFRALQSKIDSDSLLEEIMNELKTDEAESVVNELCIRHSIDMDEWKRLNFYESKMKESSDKYVVICTLDKYKNQYLAVDEDEPSGFGLTPIFNKAHQFSSKSEAKGWLNIFMKGNFWDENQDIVEPFVNEFDLDPEDEDYLEIPMQYAADIWFKVVGLKPKYELDESKMKEYRFPKKEYFYLSTPDTVICDEDGNTLKFDTHKEAEDYIDEYHKGEDVKVLRRRPQFEESKMKEANGFSYEAQKFGDWYDAIWSLSNDMKFYKLKKKLSKVDNILDKYSNKNLTDVRACYDSLPTEGKKELVDLLNESRMKEAKLSDTEKDKLQLAFDNIKSALSYIDAGDYPDLEDSDTYNDMMNAKDILERLLAVDIRESKMKESEDGWNDEVLEVCGNVLDSIYDLTYEIKNCIKGAYTGCHTYEELADYIKGLADDLKDAAGQVAYCCDDEDDFDESCKMKEASVPEAISKSDEVITHTEKAKEEADKAVAAAQELQNDLVELINDGKLHESFDADVEKVKKAFAEMKYKDFYFWMKDNFEDSDYRDRLLGVAALTK